MNSMNWIMQQLQQLNYGNNNNSDKVLKSQHRTERRTMKLNLRRRRQRFQHSGTSGCLQIHAENHARPHRHCHPIGMAVLASGPAAVLRCRFLVSNSDATVARFWCMCLVSSWHVPRHLIPTQQASSSSSSSTTSQHHSVTVLPTQASSSSESGRCVFALAAVVAVAVASSLSLLPVAPR